MSDNYIRVPRQASTDDHENLYTLLDQSGFHKSDDGLVPKPEILDALRDKVIDLINRGTAEQKKTGKRGGYHPPTNEIIATADKLLVTWELQEKEGIEPFAEKEKSELLGRMAFGVGNSNRKTGDKRWGNDTREEYLLAEFGLEAAVPERVIKSFELLAKNYIKFTVHRKPVTQGCAEAASLRVCSATGKRGVPIDDEIKTLIFKAHDKRDSRPVYIAVHTRGNGYVITDEVKNVLDRHDHLDNIEFSPEEAEAVASDVAKELGLGIGRCSPLSVLFAGDNLGATVIQIFNNNLVNPVQERRRGYLNMGGNTWGLEISDVPEFVVRLTEEIPRMVHVKSPLFSSDVDFIGPQHPDLDIYSVSSITALIDHVTDTRSVEKVVPKEAELGATIVDSPNQQYFEWAR